MTAHSGADSLRPPTLSDQFRINLIWPAAKYWKEQYGRVLDQSKQYKIALEAYENATGIQAEDIAEMRETLKDQKDCIPKLDDCEKEVTVFKTRARRRGFTIAIAVPAAALIGYGTGYLLSPR